MAERPDSPEDDVGLYHDDDVDISLTAALNAEQYDEKYHLKMRPNFAKFLHANPKRPLCKISRHFGTKQRMRRCMHANPCDRTRRMMSLDPRDWHEMDFSQGCVLHPNKCTPGCRVPDLDVDDWYKVLVKECKMDGSENKMTQADVFRQLVAEVGDAVMKKGPNLAAGPEASRRSHVLKEVLRERDIPEGSKPGTRRAILSHALRYKGPRYLDTIQPQSDFETTDTPPVSPTKWVPSFEDFMETASPPKVWEGDDIKLDYFWKTRDADAMNREMRPNISRFIVTEPHCKVLPKYRNFRRNPADSYNTPCDHPFCSEPSNIMSKNPQEWHTLNFNRGGCVPHPVGCPPRCDLQPYQPDFMYKMLHNQAFKAYTEGNVAEQKTQAQVFNELVRQMHTDHYNFDAALAGNVSPEHMRRIQIMYEVERKRNVGKPGNWEARRDALQEALGHIAPRKFIMPKSPTKSDPRSMRRPPSPGAGGAGMCA